MADHYQLAALNGDTSGFLAGFSVQHNIGVCISTTQLVLQQIHDFDAHAEIEESRRIDAQNGHASESYSDEEAAAYVALIKQSKYAIIPQLEAALEALEEAYEEAADAEEEGAGW